MPRGSDGRFRKRSALMDFLLRDRIPWFDDRLSLAEAIGLGVGLLGSFAIGVGLLWLIFA